MKANIGSRSAIKLLMLWGLALAAPLSGMAAEPAESLFRACVPRAIAAPTVDGRLDETAYQQALCTPIEYFHRDAANRAAQFYYLWDDEAFYVGLRTLDASAYSPETPLWEGDAVEWYFDVRRGDDFLGRSWPKTPDAGAVHCFFTPMTLGEVAPRFTLRPGYEEAISREGVEVAAQRTTAGLEVEFKLPWKNFPSFTPRIGEAIGLDAELSYSDGGPRSYRSFVFGSPLSVQQPANLARVKLVKQLDRADWEVGGPVMMPMRIDVPWSQEGEPQVVGRSPCRRTAWIESDGLSFKSATLPERSLANLKQRSAASWRRPGTLPYAKHAGPLRWRRRGDFKSRQSRLTRRGPNLPASHRVW